MGTLYLVPTPIGNLEDITLRAINTLKRVSLVAAEDTRETRKLLVHYSIATPLTSFHEHNESSKLSVLLNTLRKDDIALVSDAGSPGIADPGFTLVKAALAQDIPVIALPGATAFVPAITASGMPTDTFVFLGFLGKKSSQRQKKLEVFKDLSTTLIIYESPYRIEETLQDLLVVLGDRQICIAREISKKFETYYRASLSQIITFFEEHQVPGEMVIIVEGNSQEIDWNENQILQALQAELKAGQSLSSAAKTVATLSGQKKSHIYKLGLDIRHKT